MAEPNLPKSNFELEVLRGQAEGQMIGGIVKSVLAVGGAASVLEVVRPGAPRSVNEIAKKVFGGKFTPSGKGERLRPTKFALLYAAPPPLGIAPPEFYGLRPDYLGRLFPGLPKSELLATEASPERQRYADAMSARRDLQILEGSIRKGLFDTQLRDIVTNARRRAEEFPFLATDAANVEAAAVQRYGQINSIAPLLDIMAGSIEALRPAGPVPEPLQQNPPVGGFVASLARRIQAANQPDPPPG